MASSIIEAITEFIGSCPLLEDGVLRVDAMGENAIEYTVETGIFDPLLKRYVNGDEYRQYQFNFGSREYYSTWSYYTEIRKEYVHDWRVDG